MLYDLLCLRKCMLHDPANTSSGVLEPLKDSSQTQNTKIRPMEIPWRDSQHCGAPERERRTYTELYLKNIMKYVKD